MTPSIGETGPTTVVVAPGSKGMTLFWISKDRRANISQQLEEGPRKCRAGG